MLQLKYTASGLGMPLCWSVYISMMNVCEQSLRRFFFLVLFSVLVCFIRYLKQLYNNLKLLKHN